MNNFFENEKAKKIPFKCGISFGMKNFNNFDWIVKGKTFIHYIAEMRIQSHKLLEIPSTNRYGHACSLTHC